jgi:anti-sigma B factor antagonist
MPDSTVILTEKITGKICVIEINGELDAKTSPLLKGKLDSVTGKGIVKIVCDCPNLKYISSAGIGVINAALIACKSKGGDIAFAGVSKVIKDTMDVMYFTKKVRLFKTAQDAVNALQ